MYFVKSWNYTLHLTTASYNKILKEYVSMNDMKVPHQILPWDFWGLLYNYLYYYQVSQTEAKQQKLNNITGVLLPTQAYKAKDMLYWGQCNPSLIKVVQ